MDPLLIESLSARHKVVFTPKVPQEEDESDADYCKRRLDDANAMARKIFEIIAPPGTKDAAQALCSSTVGSSTRQGAGCSALWGS